MRKTKFIAIIISIILVSVVVIPIAINESYKHGVVYVTKWDATDVLSFYGTLLGAATTAITLIGTIQFTRKQIQRNQFLEDNRRKWEKVESIITQALIDVSPLKILRTCIHNLKRRVDGSFSAILRCVFLQYTKYSCENAPCLAKKSLAHPASSAVNTGSESFLHPHLADILFIAQHSINGRGAPLRFTCYCFDPMFLQIPLNLAYPVTLNVEIEDFAHDLSFLRHDL